MADHYVRHTVSSNNNNKACSYNPKLGSNLNLRAPHTISIICSARRRIRYDEEEETDGHNAEIAMLEYYTQSVKEEALVVRAEVDKQEVEVVIFKGFSSSLSHSTCPDPSRSILPVRAVIKSIDRIKGPFNPSNIQYIDKGLSWETFKTQFQPKLLRDSH